MRAQQTARFVVAFADDSLHLGVDLRAVSSLNGRSAPNAAGLPRYGFWRGASCTSPSLSLIPQRVTMLRASSVACSMSLSAPVVFVP